jgi:5,5'-dehydrodivanillate O-demethylase oxygenase subunit
MLSKAENELLTQVGPGTPAGEMLRRYWIPVGISDELKQVPCKVRYLCEDLVLFRDQTGAPGLLGLQCPHRLSSLEFGRIEDGGIRCAYHGWLFDLAGQCLEQPGEPDDSNFKDKCRHTAYPCRDHGGLVFAYMGPGEAPLLPNWEILVRTDMVRKASMDWPVHPCNYLQIVENDSDPVHAVVLHNDPSFAQNRYFPIMPKRIDFEETEYGVRYTAYRDGPEPGTVYKRRVNSLMPFCLGFGGGKSATDLDVPDFGGSVRFRVPIDDGNTAFFSVYAYARDASGSANLMDMGGIFADRDVIERSRTVTDWEPDRDADDRPILDQTWKQDYVAIVSQGETVDRTREKLGASDRGVTMIRKMYLKAIKDVREGRDPLLVRRDPENNPLVRLPITNVIENEAALSGS